MEEDTIPQNFGDSPSVLFNVSIAGVVDPQRKTQKRFKKKNLLRYIFVLKGRLQCIANLKCASPATEYILAIPENTSGCTCTSTVSGVVDGNVEELPPESHASSQLDKLSGLVVCISGDTADKQEYLFISLPQKKGSLSTGTSNDLSKLGRCIQASMQAQADRTQDQIYLYCIPIIQEWQHGVIHALQQFLFPRPDERSNGAAVGEISEIAHNPVYKLFWQQWLTYEDGKPVIQALLENFKLIWQGSPGSHDFDMLWAAGTRTEIRASFIRMLLDFMLLATQSPAIFLVFGCAQMMITENAAASFSDLLPRYTGQLNVRSNPDSETKPGQPSTRSLPDILGEVVQWSMNMDSAQNASINWWNDFVGQYFRFPPEARAMFPERTSLRMEWQTVAKKHLSMMEATVVAMSSQLRLLLQTVIQSWNEPSERDQGSAARSERAHPEMLDLQDFLCLLSPRLGALYCANKIVDNIFNEATDQMKVACLNELFQLFLAVPAQWVAKPVCLKEDDLVGRVGKQSGDICSIFNVCSRIRVDAITSPTLESIYLTAFRKPYAFDDDCFAYYVRRLVKDNLGGSSESLRLVLDVITRHSDMRTMLRKVPDTLCDQLHADMSAPNRTSTIMTSTLCEEILLCKSCWKFQLQSRGRTDAPGAQNDRDKAVEERIVEFANGSTSTNTLAKICEVNMGDNTQEFSMKRSHVQLHMCVLGLFEVCVDADNLRAFQIFAHSLNQPFFTKLLPMADQKDNSLRVRILNSMRVKAGYPGVDDMMSQLISSGRLMKTAAFFCQDMWELYKDFQKTARLSRNADVLRKLLVAAEVCDDFSSDSIRAVLRAVELCEDPELGLMQLKRLLNRLWEPAAEQRHAEDYLSLNALATCMQHAVKALRKLKAAHSREKMHRILQYYSDEKPPSQWPKLYSDAITVAYFLKYSTREKLDKTYAAFSPHAQPDWFQTDDILQSAARNQFKEAIVTVNDMRLEDYDEAIGTLLKDLRERSSRDEYTPEMQVLFRLMAQWLEHGYTHFNTPISIHHTQSICYLLLTKLMREASASATSCRCAIAKVGTGEGKSLIIAMLAVYAVLVHGKRVHIVSSNAALRDRDHGNYEAFYSAFAKLGGEHVSSAASAVDGDADIVYCLYEDVASQYLEKVRLGEATEYADYILILDEVDEMIVDDEPVSHYVRDDVVRTKNVSRFFEMIKNGTPLPAEDDATLGRVYRKCKAAYESGEKMKEGVDYAKKTASDGRDKYYLLDSRNRFLEHRTSLALQYLNTKLGRTAVYQSKYQVVCKPSVIRSYSFVAGLTGSTGGDAEEQFLKTMYDAKLFFVPPFLESCEMDGERPTLVCQSATVVPTHRHFKTICDFADQFRTRVPVLIICGQRQQALSLHQHILSDKRFSDSTGSCQLFAEFEGGKRRDTKHWNDIVANAVTQVVGSSPSVWTVTVTDYFGGRGHDYKVEDEVVDANGGMLVIMASVPDSLREWEQWVGRTKRQDHKGQYALILNEDTPPLKGNSELIELSRSPETISAFIEGARKLTNGQAKDKLRQFKHSLETGNRLHELCQDVYRQHPLEEEVWPVSNIHIAFRDFLERGRRESADAIKEFRETHNIAGNKPRSRRSLPRKPR
eukprot:m.1538634 g.1538634  ORF g.1538634 m.1538634 type:complete len:1613 (+) comp25245_c0_seq64:367-5205(+)